MRGAAPEAAVTQRMPHLHDGSRLPPTAASSSGVDLLADLAGMTPPAKTPAWNARPTFFEATALSVVPKSRKLPTSPLTLPTPTIRLPSPSLVERGPRWTRPEESGPVTGARVHKLQLHYPLATSVPLSPRLPLPSLRANLVNSGSDVGARFHPSGSEEEGAGRADSTSPVADEKGGYGPEYVQQRRQFWSTVLGDIAGSNQTKDESAYLGPEMVATEPRQRDVMSSALSPPTERESSKSVEEYAAHGGIVSNLDDLRRSSHQDHDRAVADAAARQQLFDREDDQSSSWKKEAPMYAAAWCGTARGAQEETRGGGSGGGSGTGSDTPIGTAQRAHACSLCQHRFKRVCDLKKHKAAVHAKLRPFACKQCGKTFGQAGTRSKHYRTVHVGLKPHRCGVCERTFSEKGNMRKHMLRVHHVSAPQP